MLVAGDIDAIFCAAPPEIFKKGDKRIARLIREPRTVEQAYFKETGIYPIMHVVAIRGDVYKRDRWVARSVFDALEEAKNRSVSRITSFGSLIPLPWCYDDARRAGAEMFPDGDYWPYGLEPNRQTIESFLSYAYAQGVCSRLVKPEELFAPETLSSAIE
jgi:4,5-dihydroxyphthalate decarboxylase